MKNILVKQGPNVKAKFDTYPTDIRDRLLYLRKLIVITASSLEDIHEIEETLKWGEPSYYVKGGSPIRIDWKSKKPNQYAMYFNCRTSLVSTFRILYGERFTYEGSRAILFDVKANLMEKEVIECINMALTFQSIKHKPLLGR